jgi:MFS family permease
LITAQFLAGFADQAVHVSAMFYAIRTDTLSEANAITLMPILFFAPWAIFCTLAGYFADRYSKTATLRVWKLSEIVISLILIAGFYIGSYTDYPKVGGSIVLACVFLIGTHAAFFGPAKYGAMPEILRPHILSRGNGILESTTFLANIFGTVAGGLLMYQFHKNELWIGVVLLGLSIVGAAASFMIAWLPAANPERVFPWTNPYKPLVENLKRIFQSRPLALSILGIAFFVFMVAYMRATMYMHGETRNPHWTELKTSLIVATVALGVGLGSPLAGYLSGGKVELGLVPVGCLGMTFATLMAAFAIENDAVLIASLIVIGFFSGFYMVPLYTLLQHRAPKASKGELVSTSNFVNVTGAIIASLLFNGLVQVSRLAYITPPIPVADKVAVGVLEEIKQDHGKIVELTIQQANGEPKHYRAKGQGKDPLEGLAEFFGEELELELAEVFEFDDNLFAILSTTPQKGDEVIVARYNLHGVHHFSIRKADQPLRGVYDNEVLPFYLFLGASAMTLGIMFLLWRKLPDFFVRTLFWLKSLGKFRLKAVGMQNLPTEGPVILATNCGDLQSCLQLVSATDRTTGVILIDDHAAVRDGALLRQMAKRANLITVHPNSDGKLDLTSAKEHAVETLRNGHLLAISLDHPEYADAIAELVQQLRAETNAPVVPVFCGSLDEGVNGVTPRVRVVFGEAPTDSSIAALQDAIKKQGEWIRQHDDIAGTEHH